MRSFRLHASSRVLLVAVLAVSLVAGCSTTRPVVYPNKHARAAGTEQLERDVDLCRKRADDEVGFGDRRQQLLRNVGLATIVGGAAGLAWGIAYGGASEGLKRGGAGAAAAGVGVFVKNLVKLDQPDEVHEKFVEKCLKKKGYEVLGWR